MLEIAQFQFDITVSIYFSRGSITHSPFARCKTICHNTFMIMSTKPIS